jgi:hypothetical protein
MVHPALFGLGIQDVLQKSIIALEPGNDHQPDATSALGKTR